MSDDSRRPFRLLSYNDDQPVERPGSLIPRPKNELATRPDFHPLGVKQELNVAPALGLGFAVVALFLLTLVGSAGYGLIAQSGQAATPMITVVDPYSNERSTLDFGPQPALAVNNFFVETRDAFIDEGTTFVELDVAAMQARYFKRGVLLKSAEIMATGKPGSWWSVPAGLYQIESLQERPYSNLAQVYLPQAVRFGGNYVLHGTPEFPDGSAVSIEAELGGIRLSDADAKDFYSLVSEEVPVLVHLPPAEPDTFVYQPLVEDVPATHYLVADLDAGTILAGKDFDGIAPVASVVKLMTAVVAAEEIDLDTRVRASAPTFIESLIPRLSERQSVSMYSLLQLLLVESSNEAAEVIAGQLGREAFIAAMNDKARDLGMFDSTFTDPSGLDAGNVSSVKDLYRLARYIHEQRSFIFDITNNARVSVDNGRGGEFGTLVNFNQIEDMESFAGGKVGETNAAGQTSISLHELTIQGETRTVVVIVLGSSDRAAAVRGLLEHVTQSFES